MAFKTFAPGVLTSSDVNTFLMRQAVITCTSSTRPASPSEGMTIYETDTNETLQYDGANWRIISSLGVWSAYTPTLGGTGWALGNGTVTGRYSHQGNVIAFAINLVFGSTTTAGSSPNALTLSLPVTRTVTSVLASGVASDVSTGNAHYIGGFFDNSLGAFAPYTKNGTTTLTSIFNNTPFSWAAGDFLLIEGLYG